MNKNKYKNIIKLILKNNCSRPKFMHFLKYYYSSRTKKDLSICYHQKLRKTRRLLKNIFSRAQRSKM